MSTSPEHNMEADRGDLRDRRVADGGLERIGGWAITFALVIIFLWFGLLKFADYEASGIAGFS